MIFERISELCKERGISVARLEKECDLGNATIRGWRNSNPNIMNLKKVADYLKVPIERLLE